MPSLFHKRRGSDIPPEQPSVLTPSPNRIKWDPPQDHSRPDELSTDHSSPPTAGKIRSFFRSSMSEETKEGMRRRLSSPSELFKRGHEPHRSDITSGWEEVNAAGAGGGAEGAAGRYADAAPRSMNGPNGSYASPSVFPENFSLSQTASPEASPAAKKRISQQWEPSYPLVLPEGESQYANVAPDGLLNGGSTPAGIPRGAGENEKRRSAEVRTRSLAEWEPLKPEAPKSTTPTPSTPIRQAADLPKILEQQTKKPVLTLQTGDIPYDKSVPQYDTEPLLASAPSSRRESEEPLVATPPGISGPPSPTGLSAPTAMPVARPQDVAASPVSPLVATIPGMIIGPNGKMRPAMPSRRTTLIQSPPMPQPIKNLPTMQGWPGFNQAQGAPSTPGWGGMGKDANGVPRTPIGMPRTPGWGGFATPGPPTPRTPGGGGFPFSMSSPTSATKDKGKAPATEEELRKMRRAMPVMLRQVSTKPQPVDDGGGAGDDDEDDDDGSDTEIEGGGDDDDSEVETETEPSPMKGKGKAKALSPLDRLKGKGKGKGTSTGGKSAPVPSSLSISSVINEEEENPAVPKTSPSLLERRAKLSPPLLISSPPPVAAPVRPTPVKKASSSGEPNWSIGNEQSTSGAGGWMSFGGSTPTWTPFKAAPKTPKTPGAGMKRGMSSDEGYFGSVAIPAPVEVAAPVIDLVPETVLAPPIDTTISPSTDSSHLSSPPVQPPFDSPLSDISSGAGDGNDGSDEESEATSPRSTNPSLPQSPSVLESRPGLVKRPSLYSQATRSLTNLRSPTSMEQDSSLDATIAEDVEMEPTLGVVNGNKLTPITSGEVTRSTELPRRIEIPKRQSFMREAGPQTPGWLKAPPTPSTPGGAGQVFWAAGRKSGEGSESKSKAKRRRSAGDQELPPPDYEPPHPGVVIPKPRDDEGREKLPEYWCAVHIEGMLSRKMEFQAPGVQARDRSWKKYYCILRGTSLTLYKFDPRRFVPKEGAPPSVGPIPEVEEEEHLHVHIPPDQIRRASVSSVNGPGLHASAIAARRGSVGDSATSGVRRSSVSTASPLNPTGERARAGSVSSGVGMGMPGGSDSSRRGSLTNPGSGPSSDHGSRRTSVSGSTGGGSNLSVTTPASSVSAEKDPALFAKTNRRPSVGTSSSASTANTTSALAHFQTNHLVRTYTLQNAESGLAADYTKRNNVVRIRSEGEQFLLQTDGAREVVDWIEAFQAATNVALDLDDRPMPKIITLPRRRRRRPAAGAAAAGAAGAAAGAADTPEANVRAVQEAERAQAAMDRDLAADQSNSTVSVG